MTSRAVHQFRRDELERRIEDLIALLDELDGDENLEEAGDREPWLGWTSTGSVTAKGMDDDREMGDDDEDSLGWANPMGLRIGVPAEEVELFVGCWDHPAG